MMPKDPHSPVSWERETRTFYYGLTIPISEHMSLYVPKARKGDFPKAKRPIQATIVVQDLILGGAVVGESPLSEETP